MNRRISLPWIGFLLSLSLSLLLGLFGLPSWSQTTPTDLLQEGRDLYQTENFHQAANVLENAAQTFQQQGLPLNQALALNYLALADYQLGQIDNANDRLHTSLNLLASLAPTNDQQRIHAQVLSTRGQLLLATGQAAAAIDQWQQAHDIYQTLNDPTGLLGTDINQVQALRSLGRYRLVQKKIDDLRTTLGHQPNKDLAVLGWRSLGNTLHTAGQLDDAEAAFQTSLTLAEQQQSFQAIAAAWLGIGNIERDRGLRKAAWSLEQSTCPIPVSAKGQGQPSATIEHFRKAVDAYAQSAQLTSRSTTRIRAQLNQLNLQIALNQFPNESTLERLETELDQLPTGRFAIDAKVNLAHSLMCLPHGQAPPGQLSMSRMNLETQRNLSENRTPNVGWAKDARMCPPNTLMGTPIGPHSFCPSYIGMLFARNVFDAEALLVAAQREAKGLGDRIAESYALGTLGHLYEQQGKVASAKTTTQAAIQKIQALRANEIAYQWHWQMGRLLQQETGVNQRTRILQSYDIAFQLLQSLRQDLTALNTDVQFSFRQTIEPFYRQYAQTLLKTPTAADLSQARIVIESLQLAELDNFFQDACSTAQPELVDQIAQTQDPTSAILYPIILPDSIEIVAKLPGEATLTHLSVPASGAEVRATLRQLRSQLTEPHLIRAAQQTSQQVYQWLIQPLYQELSDRQTETLVFVLDTPFQAIPMAALYSGDHYLIEDFAVALTPGLQLLSPRPLESVQTNVLAGGLTEARLGFPPLPAVGDELAAVGSIVPIQTRLLNEEFVELAIASELTNSRTTVVHLATHGQFSSRAEDTFLLAYDDKIDVNELQTLLQAENPEMDTNTVIELLVLSACETALGDERAALGLAGMAVRAGARSTLATLWRADDKATSTLISDFYHRLFDEQTGNKAIALQKAQLYLLQETRFKHPRFWAPFVLLGNWL
ncbi:MAG: CHAT domain-containing protein [Cyanobacteria bacterium P01_F01_bin.150]